MRLLRPHIPLEVRCLVALRQLECIPLVVLAVGGGTSALLKALLQNLAVKLGCDVADLRLDHNPALGLRDFDWHTQTYVPAANDPEYLIYRTKQDHHIKTNVRGDGAQRSDTAMMKRERRRLKKKRPGRRLRSANRWPKVSRKIPSRPFQKRKAPK